ncbi:MAG: serine/threonine-protein kinase, partial [Gemmatimonadota bacterium]
MPERYLGKTLGKYRVEALVGSGGFAWVYRGFDPELEIPVALKVLKPQFAGDPTFEERFRREASTAAKLRHPNIVNIYAVGRDGDAVFFVMDFLPTGLADKLEASPSLPEEFVLRVGIDVARALGFAHREGVVHRDIKVDNILFDTHGNAVVADFGIARAVTGYTNQTGTNMVVGTPQYFAPEQARAKPLDGRADIYSLGVSLFRSVTGRLPFEGDDWYEIARQHVEDQPPAPRSINPAISPAFENLILRCLAKHPDDRPATGEQLADELTAILSNPHDAGARSIYLSPSDTPTLVTPFRLSRASRSWKRVAPLSIVLLALLATAITLAVRRDAGADAAAVSADSARIDSLALPGALPGVADSLRRDSAAGSDSAAGRGGVVPGT